MTSAPTIRPARRSDVPAVVAMVHELAAFEGAPEQCRLTDEQLAGTLFAEHPALFAHVAVDDDDQPFAFTLWFLNYSTWEGVHGIYLEDLYVRPSERAGGVGRALLSTLAAICVERGYRRLEWWVLDQPALDGSRSFYRRIGGVELSDWVPWRVEGPALTELATGLVRPRLAGRP